MSFYNRKQITFLFVVWVFHRTKNSLSAVQDATAGKKQMVSILVQQLATSNQVGIDTNSDDGDDGSASIVVICPPASNATMNIFP